MANIFLLIIFYIWSSIDIINVEKDPRGSFYIFAIQFNFLFFSIKLIDAIRFTNFISIIFWLLVLRPIIIGEYPNLKILPFADNILEPSNDLYRKWWFYRTVVYNFFTFGN